VATSSDRRAAILLLLLAAAGLVARFWQSPGAAPGAVAYSAPGPRPGKDSVAARAARLGRPLAAGERIDVDRAPVEELARLPRVGPGLAGRIVADREEHGPFGSLEGLDRVSGIGPTLLAAIRPHAAFSGQPWDPTWARPARDTGGSPLLGPPDPRPASRLSAVSSGRLPALPPAVRLNTASEAELDQLPGIGPALARAIVAERTTHGPFGTLEDLRRVRGLKPSVLRGLTGRIIVP
jgi:competence ComEA-like helix-hairpin-helix protein